MLSDSLLVFLLYAARSYAPNIYHSCSFITLQFLHHCSSNSLYPYPFGALDCYPLKVSIEEGQMSELALYYIFYSIIEVIVPYSHVCALASKHNCCVVTNKILSPTTAVIFRGYHMAILISALISDPCR